MSGAMSHNQPHRDDGGWREIRRYAYVERPYEQAWALLAGAPRLVLGGEAAPEAGVGQVELHVRRAGLELKRPVRVYLAGVVCTETRAELALRWEDAGHPGLFPVLEARLELTPVAFGLAPATHVGLVGRYRPPFGAFGGVADRLFGADVVDDSVGTFVEDLARRLETMLEPAPVA
jgi:hypothetical protein